MKEFIKGKLKEAYGISEKDGPATEPKKKKKKKESSEESSSEGSSKYQSVQGLLSNPIFNHSEIIRKLWHDDDATKRSLFRKKLNREANEEGSVYQFDDDELSKITTILMATSTDIRKKVGKSGAV